MDWEITEEEIGASWDELDAGINAGDGGDYRKFDHHNPDEYDYAVAQTAQKKLVEYMERNWKGYEDRTVGHLLDSAFWKSLRKGVGLED